MDPKSLHIYDSEPSAIIINRPNISGCANCRVSNLACMASPACMGIEAQPPRVAAGLSACLDLTKFSAATKGGRPLFHLIPVQPPGAMQVSLLASLHSPPSQRSLPSSHVRMRGVKWLKPDLIRFGGEIYPPIDLYWVDGRVSVEFPISQASLFLTCDSQGFTGQSSPATNRYPSPRTLSWPMVAWHP